jgi:hypothetical protein
VQRFGHAYEAGVGKAHGNVRILVDESEHRFQFLAEIEAHLNQTALQKTRERFASRPRDEKERLRQYRFAGQPRAWPLARLRHGPGMKLIVAPDQPDQQPAIDNDGLCRKPAPASSASFALTGLPAARRRQPSR